MIVQEDSPPGITLKRLLREYHPSNMNERPVVRAAGESLERFLKTYDTTSVIFSPKGLNLIDIRVSSKVGFDPCFGVDYLYNGKTVVSIQEGMVLLCDSQWYTEVDHQLFDNPLSPSEEELSLFLFTYPDIFNLMKDTKKKINIIEGAMMRCLTKSTQRKISFDMRLVDMPGERDGF